MRYIFPDGPDYLVVATTEGLLFRMNAAAARRFQSLPETAPSAPVDQDGFEPTQMTVVPSSTCSLRCVYCPTRVTRPSPQGIDPGFCRAAARLLARHAAIRQEPMHIVFHGGGEPTFDWDIFTQCVSAIEEAARGAPYLLHRVICTAGQLTARQAEYVADHFEEVQISLDGPADLQRRHRPRADGEDSFEPALQTARLVCRRGRTLKINVTISAESAPRMGEIVRFVSAEIGPSCVVFEALWPLQGVESPDVRAPDPDDFLAGFAEALDVGSACGIRVVHASVSIGALMHRRLDPGPPMCLMPGGTVIAYDFPAREDPTRRYEAYGSYHPESGTIRFDRNRILALRNQPPPSACHACLCFLICCGNRSVRGELLPTQGPGTDTCRIYIGLLMLLLSRAAGTTSHNTGEGGSPDATTRKERPDP